MRHTVSHFLLSYINSKFFMYNLLVRFKLINLNQGDIKKWKRLEKQLFQ